MKILTKGGGRDFWNHHVTTNILSIHLSLWETNCYATLTCQVHLKLCFIFANIHDGSAEAAVQEAQVATKGESPWFLLHSPHHSLAVNHTADTWSWLLGNRNQRKERTRVCYHCPDLGESSLSCHCLVRTLQCHVLTRSWWRWSSRWLGYGPEVGSGGNSIVCSCKIWSPSKGEVTAEHFDVWQKKPCPVGALVHPTACGEFSYLWKKTDVSFGTAFLLSALS